MLWLWLMGCMQENQLPKLGDCAEYPSGTYEYGQIGIGKCISGVADIHLQKLAGEDYLLLSNANPYVNFASGSLLRVKWNSIDLSKSIHYTHELDSSAIELPHFSSEMLVTDDNIAMVTIRFSEDSRTRTDNDHILLVDLTNPDTLEFSDKGTHNSNSIEVGSDPVDIVLDKSTGLAFVGNRTSHDLSVIDTTHNPMQVIPPWPLAVLAESTFVDADASGSQSSITHMQDLATYYADQLDTEEIEALTDIKDDMWRLSWIDGDWQLWTENISDTSGYTRWRTVGDGEYRWVEEEMQNLSYHPQDPFLWGDSMYVVQDTRIARLEWSTQDHQWIEANDDILTISDTSLSSPIWTIRNGEERLYVLVDDGVSKNIHSTTYTNSGILRIDSEPIIEVDGNIDSMFILKENGIDQWRMWVTVETETELGLTWQIQQYRSTDLQTWQELTPCGSYLGTEMGSVVASQDGGTWRIWYNVGERLEDTTLWNTVYAQSIDGEHWYGETLLQGDAVEKYTPPDIALQAYPLSAYSLLGENANYLQLVEVGTETILDNYGFSFRTLAGQWLDTTVFAEESAGSIHTQSIVDGTQYVDIATSAGKHSIAMVQEDMQTILITDTDISFANPVVWMENGTHHMALSVTENDQHYIAHSTSTDGLVWSNPSQILHTEASSALWNSGDWVPNAYFSFADKQYLLYSANDGNTWRMGLAEHNGDTWTIGDMWFDLGRPGYFDDAGVRDGYVIVDENGIHLWYSGFDGSAWSIGYAHSTDGISWERESSSMISTGWFHQGGARYPVVESANGQYTMHYAGLETSDTEMGLRGGRALAYDPNIAQIIYAKPTIGDYIEWQTIKGDADSTTILLDSSVTDTTVFGMGLTTVNIDEDRGFIYVASKLMPYIAVVDIRDDSEGDFVDSNYLDMEAKISLPTALGAAGFREILPHPFKDQLMAISDSPEAVFFIDMSDFTDKAYSERVVDIQTGWLSLPAGGERDAGAKTKTSMGPGKMLVHERDKRLFVSNFNANTISVFDLETGVNGTLIAEMPSGGENPYAMALSPDGNYLIVSNYTGDVHGLVANSTVSIFDIQPNSPNEFSLVTQVVNK